MRKGFIAATLLAGGLIFSTVGCGGSQPDNHEYTLEITNKAAFADEWFDDDPMRELSLSITKDGVGQNALSEAKKGNITFTFNPTGVARMQLLSVAPVAAGTTTLTVKYGKATDTVSFTITESDKHGKTESDPLTGAEAVAICQEAGEEGTNVDYYTAGVVTSVDTPYSEQYGNITFTIADSATATAKVKCYRVKPAEGATFDVTKIAAGSQVLMKGKLVNFGGNTPEYPNSAVILSATEGQQAQTIVATVAEALAVAQALDANTSTNDKYEVTGYITSIVPNSGFYMSDTKGAVPASKDQFLVYYGSSALPEEATVNAKVKVLDRLKHYVSSKDSNNYAYETASNVPESFTCLEPGDTPAEAIKVNVAGALEVINALDDGATAPDMYEVTGYVVTVTDAYSSQYGNMSFTIGDTTDATATVKVFRLAITEQLAAQVVAGAKIKVEGGLQKYVSNNVVTPELVSGKNLVILEAPSTDLQEVVVSPATKSVSLQGKTEAPTVQLSASPKPAAAELGNVTWTSSDNAVTVSATGLVTIPLNYVEEDADAKTVTITASSGTATPGTCVITVTNDSSGGGDVHDGSAEHPFTPAEARDYIDGLGGSLSTDRIYVAGIVASKGSWNDTYKNFDIFFQSDNGQDEKYFESYRTIIPENSALTYNSVTPGDYVTVEGLAKLYGSTYELTTDASNKNNPTLVTVESRDPVLLGMDVNDVSVEEGETAQLTVAPVPSYATLPEGTVGYSVIESDPEGCATVSATGEVTGVAEGTARIDCTLGNYSAVATVTVSASTSSLVSVAKYTFTNTKDGTAVTDGSVIKGWFTKVSGDDIVSSASNANFVYPGANGGSGDTAYTIDNSLKIGKASAGGSLTLGLSQNVSKVVITGYGWKTALVVTINTVTSDALKNYIISKSAVAAGSTGQAEFVITESNSLAISTNSTAVVITAIEFFA